MTDFEAEQAAADVKDFDIAAWNAIRQVLESEPVATAAEAAAYKLVSNHVAVLKDVTNEAPTTQTELLRVQPKFLPYVDQALRELSCRLMRGRSGASHKSLPRTRLDPSNFDQVATWATTAAYLAGRIQATPLERPGREPDMSPQMAAEMRAVLQQMWWQAWQVSKPKVQPNRPVHSWNGGV